MQSLRKIPMRIVFLTGFSGFLYIGFKASEQRRRLFSSSHIHQIPDDLTPEVYDSGLSTKNLTIFRRFLRISEMIIRSFQLFLIFFPCFLFLPLLFFGDKCYNLYLDILIKSIENGGPVWIKIGQYVSHRRDIIGEKLAEKLLHLRESAPVHSLKTTQKMFHAEFGTQIEKVFDEFQEKPVASGSIAQVYKAKYGNEWVAIKVRHPNVIKTVDYDLTIIFFLSRVISILAPTFEMPVTLNEFRKVLLDQTNFLKEARNLELFNDRYCNIKQVGFPKLIRKKLNENEDKTTNNNNNNDNTEKANKIEETYSSPSILVESWIDAKPVSYYMENKHELNKVIAMVGTKAFFRMLFYDNFIHADCHSGNLLVKISPKDENNLSNSVIHILQDHIYDIGIDFLSEAFLKFEDLQRWWQGKPRMSSKFGEKSQENNYLGVENFVNKLQMYNTEKIDIFLIDVGMVTVLNDADRKNFLKLIKYVVFGDIDNCANLIVSLSQYKSHVISKAEYKAFHNDLSILFGGIKNLSLSEIDSGHLLKGILEIIRKHRMRIDGHFATLLTNLVILESICKGLDPECNVVGAATPFLLNKSIEMLTT